MNRDDALKKIRKCLALSRSAETHEAAAAMRQAQKLMAEHGVNDHELSLIDVCEVPAKARSTALNVWEVVLAHTVADAFGCEHFSQLESGYNGAGNWFRHRHYVFVGMDAAPTVAAYAFEVLGRQCAAARLWHIGQQPRRCKPVTKTARGDAFAKGWVYAVGQLVQRFAQPERDKALLLTYLDQKYPTLRNSKARDSTKRRRTEDGHVAAGWRAGEKAELHRGMPGAEERRLLT